MLRRLSRYALAAAVCVSFAASGRAEDAGMQNPAPYKMVRSLQAIQDQVINGDIAASEM